MLPYLSLFSKTFGIRVLSACNVTHCVAVNETLISLHERFVTRQTKLHAYAFDMTDAQTQHVGVVMLGSLRSQNAKERLP